MPIKTQNITAVILAGGQGSRLAGLDKGLVKLNNIPLVQHAIARINPQVAQIIISANRNIAAYAALGFPVYEDEVNDVDSPHHFLGPLAGILKALQHCQTDWLLTVPADCPFIPNDLAQRLSEHSQDNKIIMAHDGLRLQPTFALIHKSMQSSLITFLKQGERKAQVWMKQQAHSIVDFSDNADAFININTEDDLKHAEIFFNQLT